MKTAETNVLGTGTIGYSMNRSNVFLSYILCTIRYSINNSTVSLYYFFCVRYTQLTVSLFLYPTSCSNQTARADRLRKWKPIAIQHVSDAQVIVVLITVINTIITFINTIITFLNNIITVNTIITVIDTIITVVNPSGTIPSTIPHQPNISSRHSVHDVFRHSILQSKTPTRKEKSTTDPPRHRSTCPRGTKRYSIDASSVSLSCFCVR